MLLLAAALWSISGVAVKVLQIDSPIAFAMWRSAGAAIAMLALLPLARGHWPPMRWIVLAILLHTAVVSLLIAAMTAGTAARGILLQYTGPAWCALFALLLQGRTMGRVTMLSMLLCGTGIAIMLVGAEGESWFDRGTIFGLASGMTFGALILVLETIDRRKAGVDPVKIVLLNNAGTAVLLVPLVLVVGGFDLPMWKIAWVMALGVVQLAAPYWLFQHALRRVPAVDASLIIVLEPVLNPIWVWMAVSEKPEPSTLYGGVAILAALVVQALPRRSTDPTDRAEVKAIGEA